MSNAVDNFDIISDLQRPADLWISKKKVICLTKVIGTIWDDKLVPSLHVITQEGDEAMVLEEAEGKLFVRALVAYCSTRDGK